MKSKKTQVLIVGAGPVGLILAHILGRNGVSTLVIESAPVLSDEPRAVVLDPEALRTLQGLDLLEALDDELLFGLTGDYLNGEGETLFAIQGDERGPFGYPNITGINQPGLIKKLAAELRRYPNVSLLYQHTLLTIDQSDTEIRASVKTGDGELIGVVADYIVGCDGGRSTVRSLLGIRMQGESNPQPWLVIDTQEESSDGQRQYRFFCDPKRPGMFLQTPHNNRRWEWMILPGEDRELFLQDEYIHALISPHVDVATIDIYRRRVYDFHAIIAEKFRKGRVFLAGDAAHMTPPFAGQGVNSGIRDVANLGWKLVAVLQKDAPVELLDSYEVERWPHAKELIDMAQKLGDQIQPTDSHAAAARDANFAEINQRPGAMDGFVGGMFQPLWNRYFEKGCAVEIGSNYLAGRFISQPVVTDGQGQSTLLDDHLGDRFSIVGFNCDPVLELGEELSRAWKEYGAVLVSVGTVGTSHEYILEEDSHFEALFSQCEENLALLRPDRFCMAAFTNSYAAESLRQASDLLGFDMYLGKANGLNLAQS